MLSELTLHMNYNKKGKLLICIKYVFQAYHYSMEGLTNLWVLWGGGEGALGLVQTAAIHPHCRGCEEVGADLAMT